MIDTLGYTNVDTLDVVYLSDSVAGCYAENRQLNPYKDFKFVTEKAGKFEGPVEREVSFVSAGWNFMFLFAVIFMLVLNKFFAPNRFGSVMSMSFYNGGGDKLLREGRSYVSIASVSAVSSFVLLVSMIVQKLYVIYGGNHILHDNLNFLLDIVIAVTTLFLINYLLMSFYSWIFETESLLIYYVNMHISAMANCNVVLIPLLMVLLFYPYKFLLIISFIVILIFFLIRIVNFFLEIRMLSKLSFVNIFLYLCTVEILPIMVIAKMIFEVI